MRAASSRRARTIASGGAAAAVRRWLRPGKEAVPLSGHGADEAWPPPVVLELHSEVSDVTIDEVALRDVVRAPERVEDRLAAERPPGIRREQVEQCLLYRGEVQDRRSRLHALVEQIELETTHLDDRYERHGHAVRAPHQRERARHELFGADGHGDEVVGTVLERRELRL